LRDVIHAFKYDGRKSLGIPLGRELGILLSKYTYLQRNLDSIIPVPLHPRKKWERGYNQSELIAREAAKQLPVSVNVETLIRNRYTRPNYLLDREARKTNIQGAFEVRYPDQVNGKTIIVIDDILTTMITMEECARVLLASGAKRVYAAALARD
jgi:ComF family protein